MNTANIPESISESNIKSLIQIAMQKHKSNQLDEAESIYKQILQVQPNSTQIWFAMGNLYQVQGLLPEAEDAYKQAVALQPDAVPIYNNLGYTFQQQGKLSEAISCYEKALELQPNCMEASVNLGNTLHATGQLSPEKRLYYAALNHQLGLRLKKTGDLKNAFACYNRAIELNPNCGEAYMGLGEIYQIQQNSKEAVAFYRQGLKLINSHYAVAVESGEEDAQTNQQTLVTPPITLGEVTVGNYSFPTISPVADHTELRPFWSVVITVYNRTDYLLECLASVLAQWQGQEQMEIIVIDDASTTPVFEVVDSIGRGIIRYYRNPDNLGLPGNWNAGIALTRGRWIHLLHDDDYILPGFYSRLQESLEGCTDTVGAAFTGYQNINEQGEVIFRQQAYGQQRGIAQNWLSRIGVANLLNMPAVVIRRTAHERLGVYHPELTYTSDWELYIRIAASYDWWYEPEILARYRQHSQSKTTELLLSGTQMTSIRSALQISESYLPANCCAEITTQARKHYFNYCLQSTVIPLQDGNLAAAWQMLEEALKIDRSPEAVLELFTWLTREEFAPLRREIASRLTLLPQHSQ